MPYIGNTAGNRFVASQAATRLSGNGSTTAFTLEHSVGSDEDILVSVDGVVQEPSIAYAVSNGTTLTFTAAPSNGTNNIFVCYLFRTVATVDHPSTSSLQATDGTFSSTLNVTGETTLATHLNLGDNDIIKLGDSADLQIRHNANNSYMQDVGTGKMHITSDGTGVSIDKGTTENMATFDTDGAVSLFHDGTKKFETTSSGADVSGTTVNINGGGSNPSLNVKNSDTYYMTVGHDSINVNQNALKLKVNGSTFFQMDSGGHITMGSQPAFFATAGTQNNISTGSDQLIVFGTEVFDQNSDFNTSNSTFTAPVTGQYHLTVQGYLKNVDSAAGYVQVAIRVTNRSLYWLISGNALAADATYFPLTISTLVHMDENDTANVKFNQGSGTSQTDVDNGLYFAGYLVC